VSLAAFDVLARCPLLAGLPDDDIAALAACATRRRYAAGETLFLEGDPSHGLQVIAEGEVKVFLISPASGRELLLHYERRFGTVAELVALDGGTYPASAEAAEASELLVLEQAAFQRLLRERPGVALHLLRTLGRRLRRLVGLVEAISFQEVVHRLARYLLAAGAAGTPFTLDTNGAIAAQLGTVPELVSRNLSRLHAGGAITMSGRTVTRLDVAQLEEMATSAGR